MMASPQRTRSRFRIPLEEVQHFSRRRCRDDDICSRKAGTDNQQRVLLSRESCNGRKERWRRDIHRKDARSQDQVFTCNGQTPDSKTILGATDMLHLFARKDGIGYAHGLRILAQVLGDLGPGRAHKIALLVLRAAGQMVGVRVTRKRKLLGIAQSAYIGAGGNGVICPLAAGVWSGSNGYM
jgi:hypothetical protein